MKNIFGIKGLIAISPNNNKLDILILLTPNKFFRFEIRKDKGFKELPLNSRIDLSSKVIQYDSYVGENDYNKVIIDFRDIAYKFSEHIPSKWYNELKRYSSKILKLENKLIEQPLYYYDIGVESPIGNTLTCVGTEHRSDGTIINIFESGESTIMTSNKRLGRYEMNMNMFISINNILLDSGEPTITITNGHLTDNETLAYNDYEHFAYIVSDSFKTLTRAMGIIETNYPAQFLNFTEENDMESITPLRRFKDNHIVCLQCDRFDIINKCLDILEGNFRYLAFRRIVPAEGETIFTEFVGDESFNYDEIFTSENALSDIYNEYIKELS